MKVEQSMKQGDNVLASWCICDENKDGTYFVEVADNTDNEVADIYEPAMPKHDLLQIAGALEQYFFNVDRPIKPEIVITDVYLNHPEFEDTVAIGNITVMPRRYARLFHDTLRRMFGSK